MIDSVRCFLFGHDYQNEIVECSIYVQQHVAKVKKVFVCPRCYGVIDVKKDMDPPKEEPHRTTIVRRRDLFKDEGPNWYRSYCWCGWGGHTWRPNVSAAQKDADEHLGEL